MEKDYSQYSYNEVSSLYEGRRVESAESIDTLTLDIKDTDALIRKTEAVAEKAAVEGGSIVETVDDSIPLILAVEIKGDNEYVSIRLETGTPDNFDPKSWDKTLAIITWNIKDGEFSSGHRFVKNEYRRKNGLGSMLLAASESFVKQYSTDAQKSCPMNQTVAQLDVML